MLKWLVEKSDGGRIVVKATELWQAAKIAEHRFCYPDACVIRVEAYYGNEVPINVTDEKEQT